MMFPEVLKDIKSEHVQFNPFNQNDYLSSDEEGVCLALCYEWMGSFCNDSNQKCVDPLQKTTRPFWENLESSDFIQTMKNAQRCDLADFPYLENSLSFKIKAAEASQKYGFDPSGAQLSKKHKITEINYFGIQEIIQNLLQKINHLNHLNTAQIFFLKKEDPMANGHVFAIAARINQFGTIQLGFFEPNFGEALFTYDHWQQDLIYRDSILVLDEFNETWMPKTAGSFLTFLQNVFYFYDRKSPYHSFKYLTINTRQTPLLSLEPIPSDISTPRMGF